MSVVRTIVVAGGIAISDVSIEPSPETPDPALEVCGTPDVKVKHEHSNVSFAYRLTQPSVAKGGRLDLDLPFDLPVINAVDIASVVVEITRTKAQDLLGVELIF